MKMSRKKFMQQFAKVTVAAAVLPSVLQAKNSKSNLSFQDKTAIVVGAGLAGLTAAYELIKKGFSVKIIEASFKSGGRIDTHFSGGLTAELGGEWISSEQKEILNLMKNLGLGREDHRFSQDLSFDSNLKEAGTWDLTQEYKDIIGKLVRVYKNMSDSQKEGLDKISFYNYLNYQGVSEKDLRIADTQYGLSYGESIRHISAEKVLFDLANKANRFGREFKIQNGNIQIIRALEQKAGKANIIFSDPVAAISQNSPNVTVTTKSGATYTAEVCIFTVPPAAMHNIGWSPDLPREKKLAGIQLKYGRIAKSLLYFDKKFWPREDYAVLADGPVEMLYHATAGQNSRKGILTAVATGDKADMFFRKNDAYTRELLKTAMMAAGINQNKIPDFSVKSVSFEDSPFIRGSVSVYSGGSYSARESLQKPHGRVLFAGEHLGDVTGTMNAAVQSAITAVAML